MVHVIGRLFGEVQAIPYDSALAVIIDVRTVIPGSGTSSPSGWAALPVYEAGTRFVASGYYQLPLFQVR
jgi:hypothetical protein